MSKLCICYSLSLKWLDWLQLDVQALYLLLPLAQLIRSGVANRGPNLVCVTPSRSIDWDRCCKWRSKPCMRLLAQLIRLHAANRGPVQTSHWLVHSGSIYLIMCCKWRGPILVCVIPSRWIDQSTCCKWRFDSRMRYSLSPNWLYESSQRIWS